MQIDDQEEEEKSLKDFQKAVIEYFQNKKRDYWPEITKNLETVNVNLVKNILFEPLKKKFLEKLKSRFTILQHYQRILFDADLMRIFNDAYGRVLLTYNNLLLDPKNKDVVLKLNEVFNFPSKFYSNWNNILCRQNITSFGQQPICKREPVSEKFSEATQKRKKSGELPAPPKKEAPKRIENKTFQRANVGQFIVRENYNRQQLNKNFQQVWNSQFLLFTPKISKTKDDWLIEAVKSIASIPGDNEKWQLWKPERIDDVIILLQESQFWLAQYQSDILRSCSFNAPNSLRKTDSSHSVFRDNIMYPLIKLVVMMSLKKGDYVRKLLEQLQEGETVEFKFIPHELWVRFVSIQFPLAAFHLFKDTDNRFTDEQKLNFNDEYQLTYVGNPGGKNAIEVLKNILHDFVMDEVVVIPSTQTVARLSKVEEKKDEFFRISTPSTCLNDDDIYNFLKFLKKQRPNAQNILIDSQISTKSSNPQRIMNRLTESLKKDEKIQGFVVVRNVDNNHWITLYIPNNDVDPVVVYDSLNQYDYTNDEIVMDMINFIRQNKGEREINVPEKPEVQHFFDEPIQADTTSCGLFSLIITQALFLNRTKFLDAMKIYEFDEQSMRSFILEELKTDKLFSLEKFFRVGDEEAKQINE